MTEQTAKLFTVLLLPLLGVACSGDPPPSPPVHPRSASVLNQKRVLMQHNDPGHTGAYLQETVLNVASVSGGHFGKLFSRAVDGQIYAQPLYMAGISIPNQGIHNVVYVATEHNSVYAYDADHADQEAPLWQAYLGPPVPSAEIDPTCMDVSPEVGITSTPVIDPATNTLYVAAKIRDDDGPRYWLHALDVATGLQRQHSPMAIQAMVPGDGDGSSGGQISLDARLQLNRPGLTLSNGVVYLGFGAHCDIDPYHGWVLGYDAATLAQRYLFNDTPHGGQGGIWQGGNGLSADADGNLYLLTGNGTFDMAQAGPDLGESILKLTPSGGQLILTDWYTPHDEQQLEDNDWDLSTGALLPPDNNLLIGGNKAGTLYVLDRRSLGHFHPNDDSQILQRFQAGQGALFASPVYWHGPQGGMVYLWPQSDRLKAYRVTDGGLSQAPVAMGPEVGQWSPLSLSASGAAAGSAVLWAIQDSDTGATLRAYDAEDVTRELWNSQKDPQRDDIGAFAKFNPPTVVNGKVYVPTSSGALHVFGLQRN